jgi:Fe2+ or Zn2+ uptake regulation protein
MEQPPDFTASLRSQGFKATRGRIALLKTLWSAKQSLTVNEISKKLDLNVVTLYRALDNLAKSGLLMRGSGSGDIQAAHFSYPRGIHHHHLLCMDCGFIKSCANCN